MGNFFADQRNAERKAKEAFVRHAIDGIVERKKREKRLPARASWRELRDILQEEHWAHLEAMIKRGVVVEYRGIHYSTYEVNWAAYNDEEAFEKQMKKVMR